MKRFWTALACIALAATPALAADVIIGKSIQDVKRVVDADAAVAWLDANGVSVDPCEIPGGCNAVNELLAALDRAQDLGTDPPKPTVVAAAAALEKGNTLRWADTRAWVSTGSIASCRSTADAVGGFLGLTVKGEASVGTACVVKFTPRLVLRVEE